MNITGIICEYNPFHNGHRYHIEQTRKICSSDFIIGIMSGSFTQRGTPAVTDKYTRTRMALEGGCDIVIELPVRYATSSAEGFAHGAINTLKATNIVDSICFGTEQGALDNLVRIADIIENEPLLYKTTLLNELKNGLTYPQARNRAITVYCDSLASASDNLPINDTDITLPNNILAVEYLRACKKTGLTTHSIKRTDAGYHEISLDVHKHTGNTADDSIQNNTLYCSASAIRNAIENTESESFEFLSEYVPYDISSLLLNPMKEDDFSMHLYTALSLNSHCLDSFLDISSDLAARINNNLTSYENMTQFVSLLKTKQFTYTRIQRALCHCMLSLKESKTDNDYPAPYIRILGFRQSAGKLIKHMTKTLEIPVITKASAVHTISGSLAKQMLNEDIYASEIYNKTRAFKYSAYPSYNKYAHNEYTHGMIII